MQQKISDYEKKHIALWNTRKEIISGFEFFPFADHI